MDYKKVFEFDNLYNAALKCCNGVRWKTSVINYERNLVENVAVLVDTLRKEKYKLKRTHTFNLRTGRGKIRNITALNIADRPVQRCLCDQWLDENITKRLIYNSGACLKGKGFDFSLNMVKKDLRSYATNHKNEGYVLTIDFSNFFGSIDQDLLCERIDTLPGDKELKALYKYLIHSYGKGEGVNLGSQISHISALFFLNPLDHYIKERLHVKYYGRYMDDCYLISDDKNFLKDCLLKITEFCERMKLNINPKKTIIRKVKNFMYLNRHWYISSTGVVRCKLSKSTLTRLRRVYRYLTKNKPDAVEPFLSSVKSLEKQSKGVLKYVCS